MSKTTNKSVQEQVASLQKQGHAIDIRFEGYPARAILTFEGTDVTGELKPPEALLWLSGFQIGHKCETNDEIKAQA